MVELVQELIDAIVDQLAQTDAWYSHKDLNSLRACTLAARRFLAPSQRHLFRWLTLNLQTIQNGSSGFTKNPRLATLASYVRDLYIEGLSPLTTSTRWPRSSLSSAPSNALASYHKVAFIRVQFSEENQFRSSADEPSRPCPPILAHLVLQQRWREDSTLMPDKEISISLAKLQYLELRLSMGGSLGGVEERALKCSVI
ncbi:hypothetical protein C8R44DRAFT_725673 [Mycena epipterygia]|nr:hypothetical protein C8R44DRAFT_725673 [Mycena epipterygia]